MTGDELGHLFERAEDSFARAADSARRTGAVVARADEVLQRAGRSAAARAAASRERQRLNRSLGKTLGGLALILAAIWVATMIIGMIQPIGMFGFIAAVAIAGLAAGGYLARGRAKQPTSEPPAPDLPPEALVDRLDSYLFRARPALPPPAQGEIDRMLARLPTLKPSLAGAAALDPAAQDARRLMGTHLPNLIDHYLKVPAGFRNARDGGGMTVDERLSEALRAGGRSLDEIAERLARDDVAAFETQGRFIESRYGEKELER